MSENNKISPNNIDIVALWISTICLIHCLALPILALALPFLNSFTTSDLVHQGLIALAAPISIIALYRTGGWRDLNQSIMAIVGIFLLGIGAFVPYFHPIETGLSVVGASILAFVHYRNSRVHRCNDGKCAREVAT